MMPNPDGRPRERALTHLLRRLSTQQTLAPNERACVVTVGGSGVGAGSLGRVIEAFPDARRRVPGLRVPGNRPNPI